MFKKYYTFFSIIIQNDFKMKYKIFYCSEPPKKPELSRVPTGTRVMPPPT